MKGKIFTEKMEKFFAKFTDSKLQKIFGFVTLSFLRVRMMDDYIRKGCGLIINYSRLKEDFEKFFSEEMFHEFQFESMKIMNDFLGFVQFTDEDEEILRQYCEKISQAKEGSLEEHLNKVFSLETITPFSSIFDACPELTIEYVVARIFNLGLEESFGFIEDANNGFNEDSFGKEIISFYKKMEYILDEKNKDLVIMKKGEDHYRINFNCILGKVFVSVRKKTIRRGM